VYERTNENRVFFNPRHSPSPKPVALFSPAGETSHAHRAETTLEDAQSSVGAALHGFMDPILGKRGEEISWRSIEADALKSRIPVEGNGRPPVGSLPTACPSV